MVVVFVLFVMAAFLFFHFLPNRKQYNKRENIYYIAAFVISLAIFLLEEFDFWEITLSSWLSGYF